VTNLALAVPVVFLVLWLPGLLLASALRPAAGVVRNLAVAPAASYGLLMAIGLAIDAIGVDVRWWSVLLPALAVGVALVIARRRFLVEPREESPALRLSPLELAVLTLVVVGALAVWVHASHWGVAVPPNDDGAHHGLFTARILRLGTLDPGRVGVGDVLSNQPALGYYPFGMHLVAAMVAQVSGLTVGAAVDAVAITGAAVVLPLGVFVLTRRVFPLPPYAATVAAVFAVAFPAFPYYVAYWGGLTMIAGVAMVPAVADAALGVARDGRFVPVGVLFGLAFVGLFEVHNTEIVTAVVIVAAFVLLPVGRDTVRRLRAAAPAWAVGAGCFLLVALPQAPTLAANATSRVVAAPLPAVPPHEAWSDAFTTFIGFGTPARGLLAALVIIGLVAAAQLRAAGWLLGGLVFVLLTFASARRYSWADTLTSAWYTRWDRVVIDELFFIATFAALGFVSVVQVVRMLTRRWSASTVGFCTIVAVAVAAVISVSLVPLWRADRSNLSLAFSYASNVDAGHRAAFRYLEAHVQPGDRVLNDITQDSGWMYADNGVTPLFAMAVRAFPAKDWGQRIYLLRNASHLGINPTVTQVADQWHVQWAFVSSRLFPSRKTMLTVGGLSSSPAWRMAFHSGTAWVFQRMSG
jgi:hypothetical protein